MNFVCTRCGRKEAVTTRAAHCTCGGLWKLEANLPAFDLSGVDTHEWSLFRYRKFMALEDESWRAVTMGEGMTPVVVWTRTCCSKWTTSCPPFPSKTAARLC